VDFLKLFLPILAQRKIIAHLCTLIWKNCKVMAKVCQITGKRTRVGNNVSHANNKTKRKFFPNLQKKRFFLPSTGEWVTLKVATSALRTINKNGIEATIQKAYDKGTLTF
jgi:large subunit ribosomal protein L28